MSVIDCDAEEKRNVYAGRLGATTRYAHASLKILIINI
jgi:hypothetical protein